MGVKLGPLHRVRVFENSMLKNILQSRGMYQEAIENHIVSSFMISVPHQILIRWSNEWWWGVLGVWHTWRRREMHLGFCRGTRRTETPWKEIFNT